VLDREQSLRKILGTTHPQEMYNAYKDIWQWLNVAYDKEYYNTQYEIKFSWFDPTIEWITKVSDFLWTHYGKNDSIQNKWPDFVGTHIHIFNSYSPTSKGIIEVIARVFEEMATFWKIMYEDDRICNAYKLTELQRLVTSNNLLKFADSNMFFNTLRNIQEHTWVNYQYRDIWFDRAKYAPVIWSGQRRWKEYSLELRYISNTYFLLEDPEKILQLVEDCASIVENRTTIAEYSVKELTNSLQTIFYNYLTLASLLYGIKSDMSIRNVEKLISELLPLTTTTPSQTSLLTLSQINMSMISNSDIFARSHPPRRRQEEPVESDEDSSYWEWDDTEEETAQDWNF